MLAVELAPALIRSFPDPYNPANAIMPLPHSKGSTVHLSFTIGHPMHLFIIREIQME